MDKEITVNLTMRQALALLAVSLEHGISRHSSRPELVKAEIALAQAIAEGSKPPQDAQGSTQSANEYIADEGM